MMTKTYSGLFRLVRRRTPFLFLLGLFFVSTTLAQPQQVTVREINEIDPDSVAALMAGGASLTIAEIQGLIFNDLVGEEVQFTAVVMTSPRNSGLSTLDGNGFPFRIHVFVRDTSATSMGKEGMGIQLVDSNYPTTGLLNMSIGDVINVIGTVSPFNTTMQITPSTITFLGTLGDLGLPASLLDPVLITTSDANMTVGTGNGVQTNWENLADLRGQFVRLEDAIVVARSLANPDRPDFYVSSDAGTTVLNFYDTSLRFRNDRDDYPTPDFNPRPPGDDFVPPPPGATVDMQGFLTFPADDGIGRSVPFGGILSINPFEDRGCVVPPNTLRCDLEVVELGPTTRYVDTAGSDTGNDCTNPLDPCATITQAVSQANDGDTIDVAAGTYNEPGLLIEKDLNIEGAGVVVE